jgi:hypothetical protein
MLRLRFGSSALVLGVVLAFAACAEDKPTEEHGIDTDHRGPSGGAAGVTCDFEGVTYQPEESRAADCNTCICTYTGGWECTIALCLGEGGAGGEASGTGGGSGATGEAGGASGEAGGADGTGATAGEGGVPGAGASAGAAGA